MTPMMVMLLPSSRICLPRMRGSPPKCRCHRPWLTTTTGAGIASDLHFIILKNTAQHRLNTQRLKQTME